MKSGRLKSIPTGKYFGFIRAENKEYFFHRDDYIGDWLDLVTAVDRGEVIELKFDMIESPKGPRAGNVERVNP